jgi:hypothetical protein
MLAGMLHEIARRDHGHAFLWCQLAGIGRAAEQSECKAPGKLRRHLFPDTEHAADDLLLKWCHSAKSDIGSMVNNY